MKNKILIIGVLVLVFALTGSVYAENTNNEAGESNQNQQQVQTANQGEDIQIQVQNNEEDEDVNESENEEANKSEDEDVNESENEVENKNQEQNRERAENQQEQINAEQHRSSVANFVQSLLQVADREGGIGEQVKAIAQQQNQAVDATVQAVEKVQIRSKIKTFFFGSDYKNLGTLRSEVVQTSNRLEQLNKLMENIQNEGDKTELQNQIQILEQEQKKLEDFIKTNESKFSLLGWFVKLFNR
ncbi:MAG: hypothetical protein WC711_00165 [Candidatus Staskawiczbacteria bacterium]|jgi:hypothetical protein